MLSRGLAIKQGFTRKRCPKCGGNIFLDRDFRGWYEECLQCGRTSNLPDLIEVGEKGSKDTLGQARVYCTQIERKNN